MDIKREARTQVSPSTRRAWIEILLLVGAAASASEVALHPEGVDRNLDKLAVFELIPRSPSTRRAWIEMVDRGQHIIRIAVALHPEGVDRNVKTITEWSPPFAVALHPEGVDRNGEFVEVDT